MEYSNRSHTLVTFFLLVIFIGAAQVGVGVWLHFYVVGDNNVLESFFEMDSYHKELYSIVAYARIALGALSIFSTLCALLCCVRMLKKLQVTFYSMFVIFLVCAEITGIVVPVLYKDSSLKTKEKELKDNITLYGGNSQAAFYATQTIDNIQSTHKCCGVNGPADYPNAVPSSCCASVGCSSLTYQQGCLSRAFETPAMQELNIMIYVAVLFVAVEIIALILSFVLCSEETSRTGNKYADDSSQKTIRSSYKSSQLDAYGQTGKVQTTTIIHHIPAPNDPVYNQVHMQRYQQRMSTLYHNDAASDMSAGSTAVFQAQKSPKPQRNSQNFAFNPDDPSNDVLYYHDHMKRFPVPNRKSSGEDQAAVATFE